MKIFFRLLLAHIIRAKEADWNVIEGAIRLVYLSRKASVLELSAKCRLLGFHASDAESSKMLVDLARAYEKMLEGLERQNEANILRRRLFTKVYFNVGARI
jgi:hypothetical protein